MTISTAPWRGDWNDYKHCSPAGGIGMTISTAPLEGGIKISTLYEKIINPNLR